MIPILQGLFDKDCSTVDYRPCNAAAFHWESVVGTIARHTRR